MALDELTINEELLPEKGVVLFRVFGQLNSHTYEKLETIIQENLTAERYKMIFDLSGVEYIASTCVATFLTSAASAEEHGGMLVLMNPSASVKLVFEMLGLMELFKVSADLPAALGRF